ncbi:hypothetical protein BAZ12_15590 [Elizabethkingia miricola]|nr:hypothetical protein BGV45_25830 [Serratia marcescens]OPC06821.1 hypothetical protein BAY01_18535 [Elizabethkingia miricola]OPC67969.1 hypothetical protein BAZ12_15590 [Elizabethkingia miricola]
MTKGLTITIFSIFILYLIISIFANIPTWFSTCFYILITIGAIYFFFFKLEGHKEIRKKFGENFDGFMEKKNK